MAFWGFASYEGKRAGIGESMERGERLREISQVEEGIVMARQIEKGEGEKKREEEKKRKT